MSNKVMYAIYLASLNTRKDSFLVYSILVISNIGGDWQASILLIETYYLDITAIKGFSPITDILCFPNCTNYLLIP